MQVLWRKDTVEKRHREEKTERCKGGVCWKLAASPQTLVNWKLPLIWKVAKKKLQACETRGKLIIAACWILVKACQLLMEDPAHKDTSSRQRQIAKTSCSSTNSFAFVFAPVPHLNLSVSNGAKNKEHPGDKLTNSHCFSTNSVLSTFSELTRKDLSKINVLFWFWRNK